MRRTFFAVTDLLRDETGAASLPWLYAGLLALTVAALGGEAGSGWSRPGPDLPFDFWRPSVLRLP